MNILPFYILPNIPLDTELLQIGGDNQKISKSKHKSVDKKEVKRLRNKKMVKQVRKRKSRRTNHK